MPKYWTEVSEFKGNPTIEISRDEGFPYDEHFCFGIRKAKLILTGFEWIEEFYDSGGKRPKTGEKIEMDRSNFGVPCTIQKWDRFKTSYGKWVDNAYLKICHSLEENMLIGFGLMKAAALLGVEQDIRQFVSNDDTGSGGTSSPVTAPLPNAPLMDLGVTDDDIPF